MSKYNKNVILSALQNYIADYDNPVEITDGYSFNMKDTINKIELYRASKFKTGDRDAQGNKKYFINIVNAQCGNATKNIDLNRKDIRVFAAEKKDYVKSMLYTSELKYWMRKNNIGVLLNKISEQLPIYGSVVLKKVKDDILIRPLRNLKFDPAVSNNLNNFNINSSYIIDELYMQPDELERMKQNGWYGKEIDEVIEKFRQNRKRGNSSEILIYELNAEFKKEDLGLAGTGWTKAKVYVTGNISRIQGQENVPADEVLYIKPVESYDYKKIDYLTIDGRALGLGIVEMLFDIQQRWNEMENQKALSMKISSKHIFQTRDNMIEKNILSDIVDGDILKVNSEVTPLANEERNLAAYNQEEKTLSDIARNLTNYFEVLSGESMPSGTPYRLGVMLSQNSGKLFEFIRQNVGMALEEAFKEWIIPTFENDINKEHIFQLLDRDVIEVIYEQDVNNRVNEAVKKYVIDTGRFPEQEEIDMIKESEMGKITNFEYVKIPAGMYGFDKELVIDITGEQTYAAAKVETINNMLQLLAQNPGILTMPETKGLFKELQDITGVGLGSIKASQPAINQVNPEAMAGMIGNVPLAK